MMTKNFIHGMSGAYDERMPILSMLVAASLTVPSVRIALAFSPRGAMPPLVARAARRRRVRRQWHAAACHSSVRRSRDPTARRRATDRRAAGGLAAAHAGAGGRSRDR